MKINLPNLERPAAIFAIALISLILPNLAHADRVKDLATVQGVRNNQLVGYGLMVGLDGTGDQTTQTPFTTQSIINMLAQLGTTLPTTQSLQLKNVAAVMVTADLPAFARIGQGIDITVSSMGNAKSLRGGTLVLTPLRGADGQVYAQAQGNIVINGQGASTGTNRSTPGHALAGRIINGATVEREVPTALGSGAFVNYELTRTDFGTAQRMVEVINREMGNVASAADGRLIRVRAPEEPNARVSFMGRIENLEVRPAQGQAKVVINPRTGSIVMNQMVSIDSVAVAHGALSVTVSNDVGNTPTSDVQVAGSLMHVRGGANLADIIKAMNSLGANPQDLLAILQAMKAAGALRAELEVI